MTFDTEVDLGTSGIDWVQETLATGHSLARGILAAHNLAEGLVIADLPASVDQARAHQLAAGGLPERGRSDAILRRFENLATDRSVLLLVEDDLRRPGDPAVQRRQAETALYGEEVYHWALVDRSTVYGVPSFLNRSSSGYPLIAAVVEVGDGVPWSVPGRLDANLIERLVANTIVVVVSAYDDEGHVLWVRTDPSGISGTVDGAG